MLQLFSLAGKIDLKGAEQADKTLDGIDKKAGGLGSKIGGAAKKVGKAGLVIGGAMTAAGGAAFAMVNKVTSSYDDIAKGSARLGVSTDAYQEMDYWASQNGMSHESMEKIVGRFNQRLGQAVNGNEKYSSALQELGVNMDDVRDGTMNTEEAFADTIKRLSELENEQDQVNLATEIFGQRTARDLLPALQDGALSMEDAKKKAEELGIVVGEDTLRESEKFQDTWDDLKRSFTAFGQQIMSQLMPIFQTLMDWILDNMPMIQEIFSTAFDIVSGVFSTLVGWIQTAIEWFSSFRESNSETFLQIWETIQEVFTNVVEFLQESWQNIQEFWQEHGRNLLENAIEIFTNIWETVQTLFNAVKEIIEQVIGYIVPWVQEKLQVLQDFWEENGEKIMSAVENAFSFIQGIIEFIMPIVTGIIEGAWSIIQSVFDTAIGIIMGLVETFSSLLTGDFEGIKDGLTRIWESLWDGIKGIVEGAWDLLSGAFSGLWESISTWFGDIASDAIGWGKDLINGFWEGVKGMGSWLGDKITGFISDFVPGPIKSVLGISSPSKLMKEYGEDTGEGFALGMEDKQRRIGRTSEQIARTIAEPVKPVQNQNTASVPQPEGNDNVLLEMMRELIQAVREEKVMQVDGKTFAEVTGDYTDEEGGIRVRRLERGLAT